MQLLKLVESQVQVGIPLPWNVRISDGTLLLARDYVIRNDTQLESLLDRGVYVDEEEFKAVEKAKAAVAQAATSSLAPKLPPTLFELWEQIIQRLEPLLKGVGQEPGFVPAIEAMAEEVMALVQRDADVAIYTAVRQERNKLFYYGYTHAVHAALAGTLVARRLGWDDARVRTLVKAALTMNASIAELQGRMASQDIPMLDKQRVLIRNHPMAGAQLLERAGVNDEAWLTAVSQHHEHSDGSGYPTGTSEPTELAQALRLVDVFTARITPRVLRPALSTQDAARQTFRETKGGPMAMALIKEFGIYPPGDFVRLKTGELAVVVRRSANANAPEVAAVTDAAGQHIPRTVRRDTADAAYAITGTVSDKSALARMPPERLYGLSLGS